MKKDYILIRPDEDGRSMKYLDEDELEDVLTNPDDYGIEHFITKEQFNKMDEHDLDTNYWTEGMALLIKYNVLEVVPVTTKFKVK